MMSRMKHLLRKFHIGGSATATTPAAADLHHRLLSSDDSTSPTAPSPSTPSLPTPGSRSAESTSTPTGNGGGGLRCDPPVEGFSYFEEEYQVQLALALSASDLGRLEDADSVQMKAATQMSLECSAPAGGGDAAGEDMESLSLRYWNYNIVDYHEKLMDGFYVVYGITSSHNLQGQMPSLVDLQATSVSDNIDYEAVIVNQAVDRTLRELEKRAKSIALESRVTEVDPIASGLIQKIADLVVDSMGGPVGNADDMSRRWTARNYELRASLETIVLPLGSLNVGLSCHRALLFKVLADRINLPCRLVKGSYFTGTDEGAINLIKVDCNSEYILDLMGAPGVLIPAEILSDYFQTSGSNLMSSRATEQTAKNIFLGLDKIGCHFKKAGEVSEGSLFNTNMIPGTANLQSEERLRVAPQAGDLAGNTTQRFEHEFGVLPRLGSRKEALFQNKEEASHAQQMKVNDVSKYVVDAAKNPEFAHKLHALLMNSDVSRSPDLLLELNPSLDMVELEKRISMERKVQTEGGPPQNNQPLNLQSLSVSVPEVESSCWAGDSSKRKELVKVAQMRYVNVNANGSSPDLDNHSPIAMSEGLVQHVKGIGEILHTSTTSIVSNQQEIYETDSSQKQIATVPKAFGAHYNGPRIMNDANEERINQILNGVAEWEIPWEDLQVGERIGIGSYGEVYRADWNGTEVAVKKFLDQDLSGDALEQIRFEVKLMLRLRHPNVVLFMGAVTYPPNLSILTEFLPRGSLYGILHRPNAQIDEKRRLKMALDVAKGMNYLHTSHPTIVHRDLKTPNLLVDKNWTVKVCDFGLSQLKHHTFLSSKSAAGTPEWMAPEVLRNEPSNEKCDVYSFGVILWELSTLQMPWNGMNPMQVVGAVGFQNRRLDIPKEVDPMVAGIISDCCQNDPNQRPSFAQLMSTIKQCKRLVVR